MTDEMKKLIHSVVSSVSELDYVHPEDIPNIPLYMDQVTTFMDDQLDRCKRYEDDKILTKTMINNYAKNRLLPAPDKKKYSKEHVVLMIFIYYFKNILSIKDIETLLKPLTDKYFKNEDDLDMTVIYEEMCQIEKSRMGSLQRDLVKSYHEAQNSFTDVPEEDQDELQLFTFIGNLIFDVYVKKQIIERLIDQLPEAAEDKQKSDKK